MEAETQIEHVQRKLEERQAKKRELEKCAHKAVSFF
jgi:hypothetical protein